jgi:hypothetical protein
MNSIGYRDYAHFVDAHAHMQREQKTCKDCGKDNLEDSKDTYCTSCDPFGKRNEQIKLEWERMEAGEL